ncbi:hypothetical protein [Lacisediminimonas sp.]|uniref:hypothetical protein n=1 Tax=Lacisediminimonas sp. TaxID=3060582 RepID=UPI00272081D2|nr:hypothetical protein [Lacisediminimonas sp.]MDO8301120.1 hypothetical protein [Lacisediminimonas sp.]MDO9217218.1 hypothetical protein [Lacisediminimonas sp.]
MQSMPALGSDDVIECLVEAISRPGAANTERNLLREALQSLVRLAQAEQLLRMQLDFNQLTTPPAPQAAVPNRAG